MIVESDLREAIDGLKTDLKNGCENPAAAVSKWSREYEIPENVLRVRFQKATSKTPEEFGATTFVKIDRMQEALEKAALRFESPERVKSRKDFGRILLVDGEKFRYVAWDGRKVWMISEESGHVFTYTGCNKIFRQLSALEKLTSNEREAA